MIATADAVAFCELAGQTDHAGPGGGSLVLWCDHPEFVLEGIIHVEHADKSVVGTEDGGSTGFCGGVRLSPMDLEFLTGIALDFRHPDPDGALAIGRVPLFYLKREGISGGGGEAQIRSIGCGFAEIEELAIQSQQDGKIPYD